MASCTRFAPLSLSILAALAFAAPLSAQVEEVPVIEDIPPATSAPVEREVEPPPAESGPAATPDEAAPAATEASPRQPEAVETPAARPRAATPAGQRPDTAGPPLLPSQSATTGPPAALMLPQGEGPVAVVPNASGTPIILQPPVIEPPEVIDDPWTIARALPWLIAGLLIGGSLALLLFQRRRRRIVAYRLAQTDQPGAQDRPGPAHTGSRPGILVRKIGRSAVAAEQGGKPRL